MWQFRGFASIAEIHQILKCCVKVYRNTFESQLHILGMGPRQDLFMANSWSCGSRSTINPQKHAAKPPYRFQALIRTHFLSTGLSEFLATADHRFCRCGTAWQIPI